jgi:hypothetical protein
VLFLGQRIIYAHTEASVFGNDRAKALSLQAETRLNRRRAMSDRPYKLTSRVGYSGTIGRGNINADQGFAE